MQPKKILIVEDEGVVALSLQSVLTKMGYQISGMAITGPEAIKMAAEQKPDVILMDIHLKGDMDGIQATEKINEFSDVPIIFLTAYADDETVKRAIKTRSHSYLVKPFNSRELYSNIEFAIYKRRLKDRVGTHRENLELLLTKLSDTGIIIDIKEKILSINPAAETLTGWKKEDLIGKNVFNILDVSLSQKGDAPNESLSRILALGAIDYLPPIATITTKGGKNRTVSLHVGMIKDDNEENKSILMLLKEDTTVSFSNSKPKK
ncbi:MAG: response regulator [Methanoregulaceae archaeon]|jgi:PAS domain S-box-containing protein